MGTLPLPARAAEADVGRADSGVLLAGVPVVDVARAPAEKRNALVTMDL